MRVFGWIIVLFLLSLGGSAQPRWDLSSGAQLLFKGVSCKATHEEKNRIFQLTGFRLSKDKKQFILDDLSADFPFDAQVLPVDLNKDGKEELFVVFGNLYTSGNTGSSVLLFIKDARGMYQSNLGFPGLVPDVLPTINKGFPDLVITGPGLEYPVYRWDGKQYILYQRISDEAYVKTRKTSVETVSKVYTAARGRQ